jgi:hypothetical protein
LNPKKDKDWEWIPAGGKSWKRRFMFVRPVERQLEAPLISVTRLN